MKKNPLILISFLLLTAIQTKAQDTVVIRTFNHQSESRDTTIQFPDGSESYQKVLMLYNMRCKDGLVSDGSNRNRGCGEWDYSNNTYISDSSRIDSLKTYTTEYEIPGFAGAEYRYSLSPTYDLIRYKAARIQLDSIRSEDTASIGSGQESFYMAPRTLLLYTAQELRAAGLQAGAIDGLIFAVQQANDLKHLRLGIKAVNADSLDGSIDLSDLMYVYHQAATPGQGAFRLQFSESFSWDGTSDLLLALDHEVRGKLALYVDGSALDTLRCMRSFPSSTSYLNGVSYIEASGYEGVLGSTDRSMSAWIRTTEANGEILSYGKDANAQKWVFRLDGSGKLRVEINGFYAVASTDLRDDRWHHVACVMDGSKLSSIRFYVDGKLEAISSIQDGTVDTRAGIPVRISRGVNNRYFKGQLDEIRLWSRALSTYEVQMAMGRAFDPDIALFSGIELVYAMGSDSIEPDRSGQQRNGIVHRDIAARNVLVRQIANEFVPEMQRMNVRFLQGDYDTSRHSEPLWDTLGNFPDVVIQREVLPNYNTLMNDDLIEAQRFTYWNADIDMRVIDESGSLISSSSVASDGTVELGQLSYMRRFPMVFEIMSFVTPYGIGLDLGKEGKTWTFDVTDFLPVLKGNKRMYMSRGGQWQEDMDVRFQFIKGIPPRDVLSIDQIWPTAQYTANYQQILENDVYFPEVRYPLLQQGKYFKLRSAITGHGQEGEFIPREHWITLNGNEQFSRTVWKSCGSNPIHPQGGTWIYDRAGWCPGMATDLAEYDISEWVEGGDTVRLDYSMSNASGDSRYIVNNQIVSYGPFNHQLDAAISDVLNPSDKVEYGLENPSCVGPTIVLRNLGAQTIRSIEVDFWINNENNKRTATWNGTLEPMGSVEYDLPIDQSIWSSASESGSVFNARITRVNGKADDYAYNDHYASPFDFTEVFPDHIYLLIRTNNAAHETSIKLLNDWGQTVYERSGMANSTLYRDTVKLGLGCHSLIVDDNDGDGISFWANSDGSGFIRVVKVGGSVVKTLQPDFGAQSITNFTVLHKLEVEQPDRAMGLKCYPNPAHDQLVVEGEDMQHVELEFYNSMGQQMYVPTEWQVDRVVLDVQEHAAGVYLLRARKGDRFWEQRVLVQ